MDPSQTGKVDTYCEGPALLLNAAPSNYDIIFLQDFSVSSHFTQRGRELGQRQVVTAPALEVVRVSQQPSKALVWAFVRFNTVSLNEDLLVHAL